MKNIAAILLSLLVLSVSVKDLTVFLIFKINQDYIAKNICVNRNMPKLKCHGHCRLAKVREENKTQEQKCPATYSGQEQLKWFAEPLPVVEFSVQPIAQVLFPGHKNYYTHLFISGIFHPPRREASLC